MPVKGLPPNANLTVPEDRARALLRAHAVRDPQVAQRIREFHPRFGKATDAEIFGAKFRLSDARSVIAREYGFARWARLKRRIEKPTPADNLSLAHHERIGDGAFRRAVDLLDAGNAAGLRIHLQEHPGLVHQHVLFEGGNYFRNPTLVEFVAENPIRHGTLPPNIVEVAGVILDAGAQEDADALNETLGLVCSGCVPRECGVQVPLIDLLCDRGADPDRAMPGALTHAEFGAVNALMRRGARVDLTVAAALGRVEDARSLVAGADGEERHRALALAAQFGHAEIVRLLLDVGEDPGRYNPVGFHCHSTPLHQAALGGHDEVVRLLVERGARVDAKDTVWQATPAGWARHGGRKQIEEYLLAHEGRG